MKTINHYKTAVFFIVSIPITLYFWGLYRYSINVPFFDDFQWGYLFLESYGQANGFTEKLTKLFSQHNEHRIFVTRIVILGFLYLENSLNFQHLALFGNIFVIGVFACYLIYFKIAKTSLIWLCTVSFLWFEPQYFHNVILSYSIPNMSVIFFAYLSILLAFISLKKTYSWLFYLSTAFAAITTFCNGNGSVVFVALIICYMMVHEWKKMSLTALIFLIVALVYTSGLQIEPARVSFDRKTLLFFVDFLTVALVPSSIEISRIIGAILFLAFGYCLIKLLFQVYNQTVETQQVFLTGTALFVLGTALGVSIMRATYNLPIAPWYKCYSILWIISVALLVQKQIRSPKLRTYFKGFVLVFSVINSLQAIGQNIDKMNVFHDTLKADRINFLKNGRWAFIPIQATQHFEHFNQITTERIANGTYEVPEIPWQLVSIDSSRIDTIPNETSFYVNEDSYMVNFYPEKPVKETKLGFIQNLNNGEITYYALYQPSLTVEQAIQNKSLFSKELSFCVPKRVPKTVNLPGDYRTGLVSFDDDKKAVWVFSEETISIQDL